MKDTGLEKNFERGGVPGQLGEKDMQASVLINQIDEHHAGDPKKEHLRLSCPFCGTPVAYVVGPKGQTRGNCQTKGCLWWME